VQTFGEKKNADSGEKQPGNYMAYRGAQLTFGKLTMKDTDMILIDMDPKDPFDFYLDHYKDQLVAGYTKITPLLACECSCGISTSFQGANTSAALVRFIVLT